MRKKLHIVSTSEVQQPIEVESEVQQPIVQESSEQEQGSEQSSQQGPPKKRRGPTKKQGIWDLQSNERIVVTFDETNQPVGDEGNEFTKFLGTLVKMSQHVGIHHKDWRKISKDKKEDLWSIVKQKFSFFPAETKEIRKWTLSDMATKWKSWKYELKKNAYDPSLSADEIVAAQTDSRVDLEQFKELVDRWLSEKCQVESTMRKKIRGKSEEPHVTGTKSFARLIHDERKKNNGVRPSRGTIYQISRTRKNGSIVNTQAAEVVKKLKNVDASSSTTENAVGVIDWMNDDLAKVKGPEKGARIRCLGKVVIAKDKESHPSQDPRVPIMQARINELEDEMRQMRETQENEMRQMRETQENMARFMATYMKDQQANANNFEVANDSCSVYTRGNGSRS